MRNENRLECLGGKSDTCIYSCLATREACVGGSMPCSRANAIRAAIWLRRVNKTKHLWVVFENICTQVGYTAQFLYTHANKNNKQ